MTPKIKRLWIKQEKQIVRLLYRKGLLNEFKIKDLYWAEYYCSNKNFYTTNGGFKSRIYFPEIHYWSTNYYGEGDEHSVVSTILDYLYWGNIDVKDWDENSDTFPPSKFSRMTRQQFIEYLRKLPTKVCDNKINKVLSKINVDL